MNKEQISHLLKEYLKGTLDQEGQGQLKVALEDGPAFRDVLEKLFAENKEGPEWKDTRLEQMVQGILNADKTGAPAVVRKMPFMNWTKIAAAAVIVLLLSVGGYFYFSKTNQHVQTANIVKNDVAPGGNKAILTLANGKNIILDSAANGTLSQQGNTRVIKLDSGQLAYNSTGINSEILYNTISTPKGGQYQIMLADGSKVWLNAASSLRFPTAFSKERNVELTGEGYFEVAHDASKPFTVSVNGMNVQVLGTHFNINAYDDEQIIKTTLLEGSVKVSKGSANSILKPGQQAQLNGNDIKVQSVDVDLVVAWKNGFTQFKSADIKSIMRQVERWYDIDVVYEGNITTRNFTGGVSRDAKLSELLKILELSNIHFRIEGRRLVVTQ